MFKFVCLFVCSFVCLFVCSFLSFLPSVHWRHRADEESKRRMSEERKTQETGEKRRERELNSHRCIGSFYKFFSSKVYK